MRKVYYTLDLTEAVLLRDYFVQHGIGADVRNRGAVRIPHEGVASEVWVADHVDTDEAKEAIRTFHARQKYGAGEAESIWRCSRCGEENPGQFELCWSCGEELAKPNRVT